MKGKFKDSMIRTNIKFSVGQNGNGQVYGFITKCNGVWKGCRDNVEKKKIVLVDASILPDIIPNVLYKCSLIPMKSDKGFIAKTAKIVKFKSTIITACQPDQSLYSVILRFGHKEMIYEPGNPDKNDIGYIAEWIRNRIDLENPLQTAEEFIDNACIIKRLYNQHQELVSRN